MEPLPSYSSITLFPSAPSLAPASTRPFLPLATLGPATLPKPLTARKVYRHIINAVIRLWVVLAVIAGIDVCFFFGIVYITQDLEDYMWLQSLEYNCLFAAIGLSIVLLNAIRQNFDHILEFAHQHSIAEAKHPEQEMTMLELVLVALPLDQNLNPVKGHRPYSSTFPDAFHAIKHLFGTLRFFYIVRAVAYYVFITCNFLQQNWLFAFVYIGLTAMFVSIAVLASGITFLRKSSAVYIPIRRQLLGRKRD